MLCFYYQETLFKDTERDSDSNCSGAGHVPTFHEWPGQATSIVKWASHVRVRVRVLSICWWMDKAYLKDACMIFRLMNATWMICQHSSVPPGAYTLLPLMSSLCPALLCLCVHRNLSVYFSLCLSLSNRSPSRQIQTFFSILSIHLYFLPMSQKIAIISGFHIWQKGSEMACAHGLHRSWCWSHPAVMAPGH